MNRFLLPSSIVRSHPRLDLIRYKAKLATSPFKAGKKKLPTDYAINHYDTFYDKVYGRKWQSIRLALLSANKYGAIVNNYAQPDELEVNLRVEGAYNLRYIYEKNQRRIARQLEKKKFLAGKAKLKAESTEGESVFNAKEVEPLAPSSDSEFEEIGAFFTDTEGAGDDGTFVNAAQMNIDFDDFVPASELKYAENDRPAEEMGYYKFYDIDSELQVKVVPQAELAMPPSLNIYTFPRLDFRPFPSPELTKANLFNYYLLDCASALPVFALGIEPGDHVADLCAAPGGKSLMMFLAGGEGCRYFLNERYASRMLRLKGVFNSFVPRTRQSMITFNKQDASLLKAHNNFDKILIDAPCTNDRHSLYENDNNIFSMSRLSERIAMPTKQMSILYNALSMVRPGGSIVYSTCSLSPIQNDGVVHMSLKKLAEEGAGTTFVVHNLKEAFRPFRGIFRFDHQFRYGTQVLPNICSNFGPMYICKLTRTE